ncbi:uncharacterized protein B0H18DRAFT_1037827 [Fomitopsis serialis]|uniref:uncharacterized protein n=1 Tax=Fomitopsis serialis TaxID=139415 RepID=UPI002007BBAA|nr:uncharacterized protein B0H18DRAFT_1037827 [Neoantrodia serialis]KAH9916634.1 hypothetical protein B0H18DRAFT_1037827 [Neoantrodia serialis]
MASYVVGNYCINAAVTLYAYERVLTVDREINLVWRRVSKGLVMPALYVGMHICMMVYLLLEIVPWGSGKSENIAVNTQTTSICLLYLIWGAISALRVYAINGRKRWTPLATMVLLLVPVATNIVESADTTMSDATYSHLVTVTRVCVIAADSLVLLETWRNTYGLKKLARGFAVQPPIISLLLRDGTTYFCVLLAVNIVTAVLSALNPVLEIADFCFVLNTILLSRFFLNLRGVSILPEAGSTSSTISDAHFADSLCTLGGSLAEHRGSAEDVLDDIGESVFDVDEGE